MTPSFKFTRSKQESPSPAVLRRRSTLKPELFDVFYPKYRHPPPSTPSPASMTTESSGCGCESRSRSQNSSSGYSQESPECAMKAAANWHVAGRSDDVDDEKPRRKICIASDPGFTDVDSSPSPSPPMRTMKPLNSEQNSNKKKLIKAKSTARRRILLAAGDSGCFTSEETEEANAPLSSRSFSDDSSYDFDGIAETRCEKWNLKHYKKNMKARRLNRNVTNNRKESSAGTRASIFRRRMPCTVEGRVKESFAVVKDSEDPYEDFRWSMLEMIVEKQMFERKDLEELLLCFLSLNSRRHHRVILEAFTGIWEVLFWQFTRGTK